MFVLMSYVDDYLVMLICGLVVYRIIAPQVLKASEELKQLDTDQVEQTSEDVL